MRAGVSVPITLRARNTSSSALALYLRGREPTVDVTIEDSRRRIVWRSLENEIIPAILGVRILQPDESLEIQSTWDQRDNDGWMALPGNYSVRAALLLEDDSPASATAELHIDGLTKPSTTD